MLKIIKKLLNTNSQTDTPTYTERKVPANGKLKWKKKKKESAY